MNQTKDITQMLIEEIDKRKVISFDVFDTLITRNLFTPRDVFYYISIVCTKKYGIPLYPHRFLPIRQQAELSARSNSGLEDITLDDIYHRLGEMLQLNQQDLELIKQEEITAEKKFCVPREEMFNIYQYALSKGKKVYFVSDMYLPKQVISDLLTQCGYTVDNNLLVSGEYGATKGSGKLFDKLKEKVHHDCGKAEAILHIGDNWAADIESARKNGLSAIYIENVHKVVGNYAPVKETFRPFLEATSFDLGTSMMVSLISHKFYDAVTPKKYLHPESIFAGSAYNLGYAALGPLLLGTCDWLEKSAKSDGIEHLLFLARDGYIIKQAWDIVTANRQNIPESTYILASRRSFNIPMLANDDAWYSVLASNFTNNTLRHFIEHRLGLNIDKDLENKLNNFALDEKIQLDAKGLMLINQVINTIRPEILSNAKEEKKLLLNYLNQFNGQTVGLVDLGHTGTIPYAYQAITGKNVIAYNILANKQSMDIYQIPFGLKVKGFLLDSLPFFINKYSLYSHIPLLETLFSAEQNQFIRFTQDGEEVKPEFMQEDNSMLTEKHKMVSEVQRGALDFVRDYCQARGDDVDIFHLSPVLSSLLLEQHFKKPANIDRFIWDDVYFENNFSGWKDKAIFSSTGKYVSIWNEANNYETLFNKKNEQNKILPKVEFNTITTRLIYAFVGEKKAIKWARSPKAFCADSSNRLLKFSSKFLKR